jgi:CelD/BcsL family acetyltransferase involved in cellulose biosynthesis
LGKEQPDQNTAVRQQVRNEVRLIMNIGDLTYDLSSPDDATSLEIVWQDLEQRADCPFFLSWNWIGTWLRVTPNLTPLVLTVRDGAKIVGLAIFHPAGQRRRMARSRGLFLNRTGDEHTDIITIEYNNILCDRDYSARILRGFIPFLKRATPPSFGSWDEIHVAMATSEIAEIARGAKLMILELSHKRSWYVDLDALRKSDRPFLESLSSNTRYQIRRALKLYAKSGPVTAVRARSLEEALAYFEEMKPLHQEYWNKRGKPGGFSNAYFEAFHLALIRFGFPRGTIELVRVSAGPKIIGIVYNFLFRGRVYAYQTGFAYEDDPKIKPGLVSHSLCIQKHLSEGASVYDFMGGDSQYKSSLGMRGPDMMHFAFQRRTLARISEAVLRRVNDVSRALTKSIRPTP